MNYGYVGIGDIARWLAVQVNIKHVVWETGQALEINSIAGHFDVAKANVIAGIDETIENLRVLRRRTKALTKRDVAEVGPLEGGVV